MIHDMKLNEKPFNDIKKGLKTIEMRLYDEKRQNINPKDMIRFTNISNGEEILTEVIALHIFTSFEELYKHFDKIALGYTKEEEALPSDMEKYYNKEEQSKYGVVGIEIKVPHLGVQTLNKGFIGQIVNVKMDRPLGSKHPKHGFIYPVNYGYIPNTVSGDGEELDAYVLGEFEPLEEFTGKVIAIIHRTNDDDDKLVVVKDGNNYTDDQIRALTEFQEQWFESIILNHKS